MTLPHRRHLLLVAALSTCGSARATITVDLHGGADFTEIQPALDAASEGDTVLVRPGEYVITAPLDFNRLRDPRDNDAPNTKDFILRSEGGRDATTIRMASPPPGESPTLPVIHFRNGESLSSAVIGFTLTGGECALRYDTFAGVRLSACRITGIRGSGALEDVDRAAIECGEAAGPRFMEDCEIVDNDAHGIAGPQGDQGAGAVLMRRCRISRNSGHGILGVPFDVFDSVITENGLTGVTGGERIEGCILSDNVGVGIQGLGMLGSASPSLIADSVIRRNGAGVIGSFGLVLSNCLVAENRGPGAVALLDLLRVEHCTIADNEAEGIRSAIPSGRSTVADCIIWGNTGPSLTLVGGGGAPAIDHSDTSEPWPGTGNISADPRFCGDGNYAISPGSPVMGTASDGKSMGALTGSCAEVILDDGEPGTSSYRPAGQPPLPFGIWYASGAPTPSGAHSLYSNQAQPELFLGARYEHTLLVPEPGEYELQLWWTQLSSRLTAVPVEITHAGGTETVLVNQRQNGGKWNSLGTWTFDGLAWVTIRSLGGGSTSADAVRLVPAAQGAPIVIDNRDESTAHQGNWLVSGGTGSHGPDSLYSRDGPKSTYTYNFAVPSPGPYRVSLWWTQYPSRSGQVRVDVDDASNRRPAVHVDQRTGGSRWNSIGVFDFFQEGSVTIISSGGGTSTCADAVMLEPLSAAPVDIVVDNGEAGTSSTGSWPLSGGSEPFGPTSLYSKQLGATYSYTVDLPVTGDYEVFLWWSGYPSRPPSVHVELRTSTFSTTRTVDQRSNAGQWNSVFEFPLTGRVTVKLTSQGNGSACADAVRFLRKS